MTDTPEAVRLAALLEQWARDYAGTTYEEDTLTQSAALLRRIPELETARDVAVELAAQYAAERDQLRAELEKVRWQPVETAPKDGIEVFVYVAGDSVFPTAASYKSSAYFEKEYGDPEYMAEGWYWSFGYPSDFHEDVISPTHWMPLPADPTPPNADQKGQL